MRRKLFMRICTCFISFGAILMLPQYVLVQGASDFKEFNVETGAHNVLVGGEYYTFIKTPNGIKALGMTQLDGSATTWARARQLADGYLGTLQEDNKRLFTSSTLPSYQDFSNSRFAGNENLLDRTTRRGSSNWWLNDTNRIQLSYEVNKPSNSVYASRIIGNGSNIINGIASSTISYKAYDRGINNNHTIGIRNASTQIPTNFALSDNYTLGNKAYEYRDTQVKMITEQKPPNVPSYMWNPEYYFYEYDWNHYQNSYTVQKSNDTISIRTSISDTGGVDYRFWDLMHFNDNYICIVAEISKSGVIKQDDGRLKIQPSRYYSSQSDRDRTTLTLEGGKQYVAYLQKGYQGREIKNGSFVVLDIPANTNIKLVRYGKETTTILSHRGAILMTTTDGTEHDTSQMSVHDIPITDAEPVDGNTSIILNDFGQQVYVGAVSNILIDGKISMYMQDRQFTHPTDINGYGRGDLIRCYEPDPFHWVQDAITVPFGNGSEGAFIYIKHAISRPDINLYLRPGFYNIRPTIKEKHLRLTRKSRHNSVRSLMDNIYARRKQGENVTIPYTFSTANSKFKGPHYGSVYGATSGLVPGSYAISETLPPTYLNGYKAVSYPILTVNTQRIAYVASEVEQDKISPNLKERTNTLSVSETQPVLFSFTDKLSWKRDVVHLKSENTIAQVGSNGSSIHIQSGNKRIKFKVEGVNDQLSTAHTLYVGAASEDKTGKHVYSRIGKIQGGTATLDIEKLMDYTTGGTTKQIRLYIEAITPGAHMNFISDTSLPITLDIIEPNHMSISFPTYIILNKGQADVNISIVDYVFFQENVPATFEPSVTSQFRPQGASLANTIHVKDVKGKGDLKLKVIAPEKETLKGEAIGVGKEFTYKVYGDGTNGSDTLSTGLWKGLMKVHLQMKLYP